MNCLRRGGDGLSIERYVHPNSSRDAAHGFFDGRFKVASKAPAENGRTNDAAIRYFANQRDLPRRNLCLASGKKGRRKRLQINGIQYAEVQAWLNGFDIGYHWA